MTDKRKATIAAAAVVPGPAVLLQDHATVGSRATAYPSGPLFAGGRTAPVGVCLVGIEHGWNQHTEAALAATSAVQWLEAAYLYRRAAPAAPSCANTDEEKSQPPVGFFYPSCLPPAPPVPVLVKEVHDAKSKEAAAQLLRYVPQAPPQTAAPPAADAAATKRAPAAGGTTDVSKKGAVPAADTSDGATEAPDAHEQQRHFIDEDERAAIAADEYATAFLSQLEGFIHSRSVHCTPGAPTSASADVVEGLAAVDVDVLMAASVDAPAIVVAPLLHPAIVTKLVERSAAGFADFALTAVWAIAAVPAPQDQHQPTTDADAAGGKAGSAKSGAPAGKKRPASNAPTSKAAATTGGATTNATAAAPTPVQPSSLFTMHLTSTLPLSGYVRGGMDPFARAAAAATAAANATAPAAKGAGAGGAANAGKGGAAAAATAAIAKLLAQPAIVGAAGGVGHLSPVAAAAALMAVDPAASAAGAAGDAGKVFAARAAATLGGSLPSSMAEAAAAVAAVAASLAPGAAAHAAAIGTLFSTLDAAALAPAMEAFFLTASQAAAACGAPLAFAPAQAKKGAGAGAAAAGAPAAAGTSPSKKGASTAAAGSGGAAHHAAEAEAARIKAEAEDRFNRLVLGGMSVLPALPSLTAVLADYFLPTSTPNQRACAKQISIECVTLCASIAEAVAAYGTQLEELTANGAAAAPPVAAVEPVPMEAPPSVDEEAEEGDEADEEAEAGTPPASEAGDDSTAETAPTAAPPVAKAPAAKPSAVSPVSARGGRDKKGQLTAAQPDLGAALIHMHAARLLPLVEAAAANVARIGAGPLSGSASVSSVVVERPVPSHYFRMAAAAAAGSSSANMMMLAALGGERDTTGAVRTTDSRALCALPLGMTAADAAALRNAKLAAARADGDDAVDGDVDEVSTGTDASARGNGVELRVGGDVLLLQGVIGGVTADAIAADSSAHTPTPQNGGAAPVGGKATTGAAANKAGAAAARTPSNNPADGRKGATSNTAASAPNAPRQVTVDPGHDAGAAAAAVGRTKAEESAVTAVRETLDYPPSRGWAMERMLMNRSLYDGTPSTSTASELLHLAGSVFDRAVDEAATVCLATAVDASLTAAQFVQPLTRELVAVDFDALTPAQQEEYFALAGTMHAASLPAVDSAKAATNKALSVSSSVSRPTSGAPPAAGGPSTTAPGATAGASRGGAASRTLGRAGSFRNNGAEATTPAAPTHPKHVQMWCHEASGPIQLIENRAEVDELAFEDVWGLVSQSLSWCTAPPPPPPQPSLVSVTAPADKAVGVDSQDAQAAGLRVATAHGGAHAIHVGDVWTEQLDAVARAATLIAPRGAAPHIAPAAHPRAGGQKRKPRSAPSQCSHDSGLAPPFAPWCALWTDAVRSERRAQMVASQRDAASGPSTALSLLRMALYADEDAATPTPDGHVPTAAGLTAAAKAAIRDAVTPVQAAHIVTHALLQGFVRALPLVGVPFAGGAAGVGRVRRMPCAPGESSPRSSALATTATTRSVHDAFDVDPFKFVTKCSVDDAWRAVLDEASPALCGLEPALMILTLPDGPVLMPGDTANARANGTAGPSSALATVLAQNPQLQALSLLRAAGASATGFYKLHNREGRTVPGAACAMESGSGSTSADVSAIFSLSGGPGHGSMADAAELLRRWGVAIPEDFTLPSTAAAPTSPTGGDSRPGSKKATPPFAPTAATTSGVESATALAPARPRSSGSTLLRGPPEVAAFLQQLRLHAGGEASFGAGSTINGGGPGGSPLSGRNVASAGGQPAQPIALLVAVPPASATAARHRVTVAAFGGRASVPALQLAQAITTNHSVASSTVAGTVGKWLLARHAAAGADGAGVMMSDDDDDNGRTRGDRSVMEMLVPQAFAAALNSFGGGGGTDSIVAAAFASAARAANNNNTRRGPVRCFFDPAAPPGVTGGATQRRSASLPVPSIGANPSPSAAARSLSSARQSTTGSEAAVPAAAAASKKGAAGTAAGGAPMHASPARSTAAVAANQAVAARGAANGAAYRAHIAALLAVDVSSRALNRQLPAILPANHPLLSTASADLMRNAAALGLVRRDLSLVVEERLEVAPGDGSLLGVSLTSPAVGVNRAVWRKDDVTVSVTCNTVSRTFVLPDDRPAARAPRPTTAASRAASEGGAKAGRVGGTGAGAAKGRSAKDNTRPTSRRSTRVASASDESDAEAATPVCGNVFVRTHTECATNVVFDSGAVFAVESVTARDPAEAQRIERESADAGALTVPRFAHYTHTNGSTLSWAALPTLFAKPVGPLGSVFHADSSLRLSFPPASRPTAAVSFVDPAAAARFLMLLARPGTQAEHAVVTRPLSEASRVVDVVKGTVTRVYVPLHAALQDDAPELAHARWVRGAAPSANVMLLRKPAATVGADGSTSTTMPPPLPALVSDEVPGGAVLSARAPTAEIAVDRARAARRMQTSAAITVRVCCHPNGTVMTTCTATVSVPRVGPTVVTSCLVQEITGRRVFKLTMDAPAGGPGGELPIPASWHALTPLRADAVYLPDDRCSMRVVQGGAQCALEHPNGDRVALFACGTALVTATTGGARGSQQLVTRQWFFEDDTGSPAIVATMRPGASHGVWSASAIYRDGTLVLAESTLAAADSDAVSATMDDRVLRPAIGVVHPTGSRVAVDARSGLVGVEAASISATALPAHVAAAGAGLMVADLDTATVRVHDISRAGYTTVSLLPTSHATSTVTDSGVTSPFASVKGAAAGVTAPGGWVAPGLRLLPAAALGTVVASAHLRNLYRYTEAHRRTQQLRASLTSALEAAGVTVGAGSGVGDELRSRTPTPAPSQRATPTPGAAGAAPLLPIEDEIIRRVLVAEQSVHEAQANRAEAAAAARAHAIAPFEPAVDIDGARRDTPSAAGDEAATASSARVAMVWGPAAIDQRASAPVLRSVVFDAERLLLDASGVATVASPAQRAKAAKLAATAAGGDDASLNSVGARRSLAHRASASITQKLQPAVAAVCAAQGVLDYERVQERALARKRGLQQGTTAGVDSPGGASSLTQEPSDESGRLVSTDVAALGRAAAPEPLLFAIFADGTARRYFSARAAALLLRRAALVGSNAAAAGSLVTRSTVAGERSVQQWTIAPAPSTQSDAAFAAIGALLPLGAIRGLAPSPPPPGATAGGLRLVAGALSEVLPRGLRADVPMSLAPVAASPADAAPFPTSFVRHEPVDAATRMVVLADVIGSHATRARAAAYRRQMRRGGADAATAAATAAALDDNAALLAAYADDVAALSTATGNSEGSAAVHERRHEDPDVGRGGQIIAWHNIPGVHCAAISELNVTFGGTSPGTTASGPARPVAAGSQAVAVTATGERDGTASHRPEPPRQPRAPAVPRRFPRSAFTVAPEHLDFGTLPCGFRYSMAVSLTNHSAAPVLFAFARITMDSNATLASLFFGPARLASSTKGDDMPARPHASVTSNVHADGYGASSDAPLAHFAPAVEAAIRACRDAAAPAHPHPGHHARVGDPTTPPMGDPTATDEVVRASRDAVRVRTPHGTVAANLPRPTDLAIEWDATVPTAPAGAVACALFELRVGGPEGYAIPILCTARCVPAGRLNSRVTLMGPL